MGREGEGEREGGERARGGRAKEGERGGGRGRGRGREEGGERGREREKDLSGQSCEVSLCSDTELHRPYYGPPAHTLRAETSFLGEQHIKFLGLPIQIPQKPSAARSDLKQALSQMLQAVDRCPVTRRQKLKLYKFGICPRLNWPLTIHKFSISWIEHELEAMATRFIKRWAGLAKSANPNLLYLPRRDSGLNLPSLSFLYKQLQVSRQRQILTSADPCVRRIAENGLQSETSSERKKFQPAVMLQQTMQEDPSQSRKALATAAKRRVSDEDEETRLHNLQSLPRQGHLIRSSNPNTATCWAEAVQSLPDEPFKFILSAAHDTLPHNANLHLWGKKASDACPLCHADSQNLVLFYKSLSGSTELEMLQRQA